jgi:hypothetical protein
MAWQLAVAQIAATVGAGAMGASSSKKQAKAQKQAAYEESKRLRWNAAEALRAGRINDLAFAYNIDASKLAANYNEQQLRKEAAYTEWLGAANESASRKAKRRFYGSQVVAAGASGVAISGSTRDVMIDTEREMEAEIQANAYNSLRQADKLRAQADITKFQGENEAWNLAFQRKEAKRQSKLESEDLRWRAKVAEMGGQSGASAAKTQGYATILNTASSVASIANQQWGK